MWKNIESSGENNIKISENSTCSDLLSSQSELCSELCINAQLALRTKKILKCMQKLYNVMLNILKEATKNYDSTMTLLSCAKSFSPNSIDSVDSVNSVKVV